METISDQLLLYANEFPEFRYFVENSPFYDQYGGWFFDKFSPSAFKRLNTIINMMAGELPAIATRRGYPEDRKEVFYSDFKEFQQGLNDFVSKL